MVMTFDDHAQFIILNTDDDTEAGWFVNESGEIVVNVDHDINLKAGQRLSLGFGGGSIEELVQFRDMYSRIIKRRQAQQERRVGVRF